MKPSRLLQRLEADIAAARTTLEADCLRAERAGYLARLGRFDEVQAELRALHERYDPRPNAAISAWLNLVEGLVIYFAAVGAPASDKLQRSLALSSAVGLGPLQALCAAWLSQLTMFGSTWIQWRAISGNRSRLQLPTITRLDLGPD